MDQIADQAVSSGWNTSAAVIALVATAVSCGSLIMLHLVSTEFSPSWRMVSEYANGRFGWLLSIVFLAWAVSSFGLVVALWPLSASLLGKIGLAFLVLGGIGQTMGGLFDINSKLHGPAALIGIPTLCIAAVVLTIAMSRREDIVAPPLWTAQLPWISLALMLGALVLFFSTLKAAGIEMTPDARPLTELPTGVVGYVGWANRLLFVATYLWAALVSLEVIKAGQGTS